MPKGYWIANADIADMDAMQRYRAANRDVLQRHGAKFLVVAGQHKVVEGASRSRHTIIEFPSYAAALACYEDSDYQAAAKLRRAGATADFVVIEGFEPPAA